MPRLPRASQGSLGSSPSPSRLPASHSVSSSGTLNSPQLKSPFWKLQGPQHSPSPGPLPWPCFSLLRPSQVAAQRGRGHGAGRGGTFLAKGGCLGSTLVCSLHHHPPPCSQPRVQGWFFPLTSTCPLLSPGCRGERLLMFSPEKTAPPPSCLPQGLAFPTSPQVGRPSKSYTQRPLAVSPHPLSSPLLSLSAPN